MKTRSHAYPEHADYRDTGCDLHDRCLTCPFERCRYDHDGTYLRGEQTRSRVLAVLANSSCIDIDTVALEAGVSRRHAYRIMHDLKETP